jgi:hypothetical protein
MLKTLSVLLTVATLTVTGSDALAQIYIGGSVGVHIGGAIAIPAPPVVVYEYAPPPPPVVMIQAPPPPPVVYVRPAPVPIQVSAPPVIVEPEVPFESEFGIGVRASGGITGAEGDGEGMGGGGLMLRFHSFRNLAFELSLDAFGGTGYAGAERKEVVGEFSALWFFGRPDQAFRLFLLGGVGVAWAQVGVDERIDEPIYVGGLGGIGVEWRLLSWLAIEADVRGFVRQRVNDRPSDPLYMTDTAWNDGNCTEQDGCTDLQGGGTFHLGALLYF